MSLIVDTHTMAEESGSREPSIFGGSEPPEADPLITTAAEHAASEHPFWGARERRANAGQSRGSRNHHRHVGNVEQNETSEAEAMPQFAPISVKELEFAYFQDGAESSVDSSSESEQEEDGRAPKKKKRKKAATTEVSSENRLASAAFGGSAEAEGSDSSDEDEVCEEAGSVAASSSAIDAVVQKRVARMCSTDCLGCVGQREGFLDLIDAFIHKHCVTMSEVALYRAAAAYYKAAIVGPRKREGVHTPKWGWKAIRAHYLLHVVDPVLQRAASVRTLGQVRAVQERSLLKVNSDGSKTLDSKAAELLLKVITLQTKTIAELDTSRMPPPAAKR